MSAEETRTYTYQIERKKLINLHSGFFQSSSITFTGTLTYLVRTRTWFFNRYLLQTRCMLAAKRNWSLSKSLTQRLGGAQLCLLRRRKKVIVVRSYVQIAACFGWQRSRSKICQAQVSRIQEKKPSGFGKKTKGEMSGFYFVTNRKRKKKDFLSLQSDVLFSHEIYFRGKKTKYMFSRKFSLRIYFGFTPLVKSPASLYFHDRQTDRQTDTLTHVLHCSKTLLLTVYPSIFQAGSPLFSFLSLSLSLTYSLLPLIL